MAEPPDPKRPAAPGSPDAPLPRLWKATPDEDVEDEVTARKKKRKKAEAEARAAAAADDSPPPAAPKKKVKKGDKDRNGRGGSKGSKDKGEGEKKGVLVEETPNLDTYETRQRIRIAVGAAGLGLLLVIGVLVLRGLFPGSKAPAEQEIPPEMLTFPGTSGVPKVREEQESRIFMDRARDVARNGKVDLAVALLKKVSTRYPNTRAAGEAREALERPKHNLPLFLDRPAVVASPGAVPTVAPAPAPAPANVVEASRTSVALKAGAQANLVPPKNAAEPPTPTLTPTPTSPSPGAAATPSRPVPPGFRAREGAAVHASGWPAEIVGDRDGGPMVLVPGGTFVQGRDDADPAEGPSHRVTLGTYYIDKHEVTVRQFNLYQKEAGRRPDRARALARDPSLSAVDAEDDLPVVLVSAREASDYCYWAGKRLPTEAQWEAAARTPDGRLYPWGPDPSASLKPRDMKQVRPVMTTREDLSPYGAFDLAGNALEWTKDWYDPRYYHLFRTNPADNPTGPANRPRSPQLVVKGSSRDWTVCRREGIKPETRLPYLGFRGALQVEGPGNAFEPPPTAAPATPGNAGGQAGGATVPF